MPEEETFAVLVKIMQDYRMREMFKPSMAELGLCMYQLDMLVQVRKMSKMSKTRKTSKMNKTSKMSKM